MPGDQKFTLAAHLSIQVGGPKWNVEKGRRDGRVSLASEAAAQLPGENFNLDQLVSSFSSKGLSRDDLVALSGELQVLTQHPLLTSPSSLHVLNNQ